MHIMSPPKIKAWSYEYTCRQCEAELLADVNDVVRDSTDPREPTWCYVVCPCCDTKQTIDPPKSVYFSKKLANGQT